MEASTSQNEFTKIYQETNIQIQFIIFDTPQQNGVVDKWNWTLIWKQF